MPVRPHIVILAGPNGAGKTTAAPCLLNGALRVTHFVNADVIALGLAGFDPDAAAVLAARIMLQRINELAVARKTFAFEATLASRSLAPWVSQRVGEGYAMHLVFLWLANAEMAIERVRGRVRRGGHSVPPETIRRRYRRGLRNFFQMYQRLATTWRVYDNTGMQPRLVARGRGETTVQVHGRTRWQEIKEIAHGA